MIGEKITRHLRAFNIVKEQFKVLKHDVDYINWYFSERQRFDRFNNIHEGEDCFIIGNGPSLKKMDLAPLNNYYTFGLNKIYLLFEKTKLDLSYVACVNPLVIAQAEEDIKKHFQCPVFLSYRSSKGLYKDVPNVYRLMTNNGPWSFYPDVRKGISEGYTVTYVAMQIAFYMGFKRVFLIGVDHNFKQTGKSNETQMHKGEDENHFHPDYFKGMQWHLADLEGNEASYALAKHQFHAAGREIIDCTVDGKLTIYPKMNFEEALKIAREKK